MPDDVPLTTLQIIAMRVVVVDIVLPARSELPLLVWVMQPQFSELVADRCHPLGRLRNRLVRLLWPYL